MAENTIRIEDLDKKTFKEGLCVQPEDKALITHYLHNLGNGISGHYKEEAMPIIQKLVEYKGEKEILMAASLEEAVQQLLFQVEDVPFPTPKDYTFKFIDLFAGIGGFRLAMQNLGGKCVFSSEWDKDAQRTYMANFGETPFGDITQESVKGFIPKDFDLLCAGFPCQAFSIAGKRGGFEDTRGTLFFDVAEIIRRHQPKAIFLENVKGLTSHDKGRTLSTILNVLRNELGYEVFTEIINAKDFGLPQQRERIFIVGFKKDKFKNSIEFNFPLKQSGEIFIESVLEHGVKGYSISKHLQSSYLFKKEDGKPQVVNHNSKVLAKTLVSSYHKIQRLTGTFIEDGETGLRLLTVNECKGLMGFPQKYIIPVSRTQAYRQLGNSVAVPAIQATGEKIIDLLIK